jgi:hypothetical protein
MRRFSAVPLLWLAAALGCGSDSRTGPPASYSLEPAATSISVAQDSTLALTIAVRREGTDTTIKRARLRYESADPRVATVDSLGKVTGVAGGSTSINVKLADASIDIPVTVRPRPADFIELTILTGPAGGLKGTPGDTIGTFHALPADPATSRVKGVVKVGNDTVFCNYCAQPSTARVLRPVRFVSLNPALATVSNAGNPRLQTSTDTTGRVTPLDTSTAYVSIVMEVPGDSNTVGRRWKDTVRVNFSLRPIDTLRIRPDSNFFPTANGTGLSKQIYPNADTLQANVVASGTTNFIAGLDFLSRVQDIPILPTPTTPNPSTPAARYIPVRLVGGPAVRRPSLPNVLWESANTNYLTINAAGAVTAVCAQIGGNCLSTGSTVLTCAATGGTMPSAFNGKGTYSIPSCNPAVIIPMPGAFCTSNSQSDLSSTCTIWIRASAVDPATGKPLRQLYRINIRR